MSAPIEVRVPYSNECDLCAEHYSWECPGCDRMLDHFEVTDFPLDVECACGTTSRITEEESERWRVEVVGLRPRST